MDDTEIETKKIDFARGYVEMACGSGKSLTSYWIDKELKNNLTVVFVPSIHLLSQFFSDWVNQSYAEKIEIKYLLIGSDADVDDDIQEKCGLLLKTDQKEIKQIIVESYENNEKIVVISTYQSSDKLVKAIGKKIQIDFAIFDEAHKTVGQAGKQFSQMLTDDRIIIKKRLFMTATPKMYGGEKNENIISMNDENYYGKRIYCYNTGQAINDRILTDYQLATIVTTNNEMQRYIESNKLVKYKEEFDNKEANYLGTILILLKKIHDGLCNHMVTYHNTIARAKKFCKFMKIINDILYDEDVFIDSMDGTMSMSKRKKIIKEYVKKNKAILCTSRVLNEGVNIPIIDSECFVDERQSTIDIVQCVGRSLRLCANKNMSYIFIPMFLEKLEDDTSEKEFGNTIRILKSMKSTDHGIVEYFNTKMNGCKKDRIGRKLLTFEKFTTIEFGAEIDIDDWSKNIECRLWKVVDPWESMFEQLKMWIDENKRKPSHGSKNSVEKQMCCWMYNQQNNYKKNIKSMKNAVRRNNWEQIMGNYKGLLLSNDEKWYVALDNLKKWIDENKRKPISFKNNEEKKFSTWMSKQQLCYDKNDRAMRDMDKREKWRIFLEENKKLLLNADEKWYVMLDKVEEWIKINDARPLRTSENIEEIQLSTWLDAQRQNYKKNAYSMKDTEKKKKWENLIEKNGNFMVDGNKKWYMMLDKLEKWMNKYNAKPSSISNNDAEKCLGQWLQNQQANYKKNAQTMKDNDKRKKWEDFVKKCGKMCK
jgi:superfamily II DNA or RNA helicase